MNHHCAPSLHLASAAGYDRGDILGSDLAAVLVPGAGSVPPPWEDLQSLVAAGQAFVLPGMMACLPHINNVCIGHRAPHLKSKVFNLSFCPAALDPLDTDTLHMGMPSVVPMQASADMLRFYAVRVHPAGGVPGPSPLTSRVKVGGQISDGWCTDTAPPPHYDSAWHLSGSTAWHRGSHMWLPPDPASMLCHI